MQSSCIRINVLIENEIGQNHAFDFQKKAKAGDERIDFISDDARRSSKRQLQRHRARSGKRRACKPHGGILVGRAIDNMRSNGPTGSSLSDQLTQMAHGRNDDVDLLVLLGKPRHGLSENIDEVINLRAPAAGQHEQHRPAIGNAEALRQLPTVRGLDLVQALDQRMTDIRADRSAKTRMRSRFERQQGQHMIDVATHALGPTRPPRPHARTDIIDDRDMRRPPPDPLRYRVRELRTVDDDDNIRLPGKRRVDGLIHAPNDARQAR